MRQKNERLALIAGVNNPIGASVAKAMHKAGFTVSGFDAEATPASSENLDWYTALDMKDREEFDAAVMKLTDTYGPVHTLVCATGFEEEKLCAGFLDTPIGHWESCLDGWLGSSSNACHATAPGMLKEKEGRIILISPDYSRDFRNRSLSAVAAGTLHGFAKSFGVEVVKDGILVNCVWPAAPFDLEAVASTVLFLAESGNYVSAQVISVKAAGEGVSL